MNVVCLCYISCPCTISECILCVVLFFSNGVNCHDFKFKWIDYSETKKFLRFCRTCYATQNAYKIMIFLLWLVSFHFLLNPNKCTKLLLRQNKIRINPTLNAAKDARIAHKFVWRIFDKRNIVNFAAKICIKFVSHLHEIVYVLSDPFYSARFCTMFHSQ